MSMCSVVLLRGISKMTIGLSAIARASAQPSIEPIIFLATSCMSFWFHLSSSMEISSGSPYWPLVKALGPPQAASPKAKAIAAKT